MKRQLFLALFSLLTIICYADVPTIERDALIAFYNSTDGDNWTNNSDWNSSLPVSDWYGITTEFIDGQEHVTELLMDDEDSSVWNNNLNGTLPSEIGNLTYLRKIVIEECPMLTGSIPDEIGNLTYIEEVYWHKNNLTGHIPSTIGNLVNLRIFDVWDNSLEGNIPPEIGNCTNLRTLSLENNQLTGVIPQSFENLDSMRIFWINGNQLEGDVSNTFQNWTNLWSFSIGNNWDHPASFNNFTGHIDLSGNPDLTICFVDNTNISTLNVKTGNNSASNNSYYFNALNTPNLSCIIVDDVAFSDSTWIRVDNNTLFMESEEDCNALTDINDYTSLEQIRLSPNPTSGLVHINSDDMNEIDRIVVVNSIGQEIINSLATNNIDLSGYPNGIYYFNIKHENGESLTHKVLKLD